MAGLSLEVKVFFLTGYLNNLFTFIYEILSMVKIPESESAGFAKMTKMNVDHIKRSMI
jgi:hypothetical protein